MAVERSFFSKAETQAEVGRRVEALADFPSVPRGTLGTVTRATRRAGDDWTVIVRWDLPVPSAYILAIVLDASVNFRKRGTPVTDTFSRSEFQSLVRVVPASVREASQAS
ncbi:MAG TPA: hypothetical protein VMM93_01545 [Vicinamibacterales bacterium]|nr:hypothetical protein [Vicinamibacterales bacterium]